MKSIFATTSFNLSNDVSNENTNSVEYLLLFLLVSFTSVSEDIREFGTFAIVFSTVLILVLLNVMASTFPSYPATFIQSPTTNGLSIAIVKLLNKFFAVSCAANVTTTVPIPSPAANPFKLYPNSVIIKNPPIRYITNLIPFAITLSIPSVFSPFILSWIFFKKEVSAVIEFAVPIVNIRIVNILNPNLIVVIYFSSTPKFLIAM